MDSKKAVALYFSVAALSMSVVACSGFKAKIEDKLGSSVQVLTPRTGGDDAGTNNYVAPAYPIQINNAMPIINFMASQNPDVMTILNDPNFMGPPYIAGRISLNLTNLQANNSVSAGMGSQIRFQGALAGAAGVEIRMESTDARIYLNTYASQYESMITGTWNFESTVGTVQMEIDANPVRNSNMMLTMGAYNLNGNLWARFGNSGAAELLGTFSIPLCSVMQDTSWVNDQAARCN